MNNKLRFTKNYIEITCTRDDEATRNLLHELPCIVHSNRIGTSHKVSCRYIADVLKVFRNISESDISTLPRSVQSMYYAEKQAKAQVADLIAYGGRGDPIINEHLTLMPHQQTGREIANFRDRYAFFYDTRTGKTPMTIAIILDDLRKNPQHKWLVVCPLILVYNAWKEDFAKFVPEVNISICHSKSAAARQAAINSEAQVYITNTESFDRYKDFFSIHTFEGMFVDESSSMKSHSSKFSKAVIEWSINLNRLYLLSGTPAPNGEHEYFSQMRAIDYYGWHTSYTKFKEYYFTNISFNPKYEKLVLRPDRQEELINKLADYSLYVDKEDVLDLPGRTFSPFIFKMPDNLSDYYKQMKRELAVDIDEETTVLAAHAAAKLNKLNQITSGFVLDNGEAYDLDLYRVKLLIDLLESPECIGKQIIIWANYRREFDHIKEILGDRAGYVYGATNIDEKNEFISGFKSGKYQYLVANPRSADKGLTLTNAHIAIYYSLNESYEVFKQSYDRIYADKRIQKHHCKYYIFMAEGTVDQVIYNDVLLGKRDATYAILDHLKGESYGS